MLKAERQDNMRQREQVMESGHTEKEAERKRAQKTQFLLSKRLKMHIRENLIWPEYGHEYRNDRNKNCLVKAFWPI